METPPTPSVKDMAKKMNAESNQSFYVDSSAADASAEVGALQQKVDELTEKLETLRYVSFVTCDSLFRNKRKEDDAKLAEFDRLKIHYQSLVEFKSSVTEELRNLRRRLEESENVSEFEAYIVVSSAAASQRKGRWQPNKRTSSLNSR